MRIVLLNQYYAPDEAATAQLLADVGAGLARAGHSVVAVCSDRSYANPERRYPRRERIDGVDVRRSRATGFGRARRLGRLVDYATFFCGAALRMLFSRKPDVMLCLSTPPMLAAVGLLVARIRRARFVFWVMDVYPELAYELGVLAEDSLAGKLLGRLAAWILTRSDRVVALGEHMASHLERSGRRDVVVIHNWADEDAIRPRRLAGHPLRGEWGWGDRFVVMYSGNIGLAHEFETVVDAAAMLLTRKSVLFSFVGSGPRREELMRAVEQRGLSNVEFRPYVERERLGESLTAPDIHLVTLRESMPGLLVPSKIYGILAAGRPTVYVGPDRGEIVDILSRDACGDCVAIGDARNLVESISSYHDDRDRWREAGARARRSFEERFTRARAVGTFVSLIEQLA